MEIIFLASVRIERVAGRKKVIATINTRKL